MKLFEKKIKSRFHNVCIVDTVYSLFLYMLYVSEDELDNTIYFLGNAVPGSIRERIPNHRHLRNEHYHRGKNPNKIYYGLMLFLYHYIYIKNRIVYAQDHLIFSQKLLGCQEYILLEDGPMSYTFCTKSDYYKVHQNPPCRSFLSRFLQPFGGEIFGTNRYCIRRLVTEKKDLDAYVLKGRNCECVQIKNLWDDASIEKREKIKRTFGITRDIMNMLKQAKTILLTQPLSGFGLSEEEQVETYRPTIEKYWDDGLVLKIHPRDNIDYGKHFPGIKILDTYAPMQLICLAGTGLQRAVTAFSTAVSAFQDDVEIVWLGTSINRKIVNMIGDIPCPYHKK